MLAVVAPSASPAFTAAAASELRVRGQPRDAAAVEACQQIIFQTGPKSDWKLHLEKRLDIGLLGTGSKMGTERPTVWYGFSKEGSAQDGVVKGGKVRSRSQCGSKDRLESRPRIFVWKTFFDNVVLCCTMLYLSA